MSELPAPHTWKAPAHDPLCHCAGILGDHAGCCDCEVIAKARADERERMEVDWNGPARADIRRALLANLRAQVEALPHTNKCDTQDPVYAGRGKTMRCTCWQAEVLALFDGSSDEAT